jgi:glycosyltransferase involved in cell wall biosynthesis
MLGRWKFAKMPAVSVIIPTYNRPELLAETLASTRAQTFTDYEVIVVSHGEKPETRCRSEAIAAANNAQWFALDQGNLSAARNFGVEQASGEWIAFLDDDDLWLPNKLERQLAEARRTGADMVSCDYVEFYTDAKACPPEILQLGQHSRDMVEIRDGLEHSGREFIRRPRPPDGWPFLRAIHHVSWWAPPSGVMVRRSVLDAVGGFDPRQRYSEDNDMWRRISWRHHIHYVQEVLLRYRRGHGSLMQKERLRCLYELRFYFKALFETPQDLRSTLAHRSFFWNRVAIVCFPQWLARELELKPWAGPKWHRLWLLPMRWLEPRWQLMQFRRWAGDILRPRRRWATFKRWARPRSRINAFAGREIFKRNH